MLVEVQPFRITDYVDVHRPDQLSMADATATTGDENDVRWELYSHFECGLSRGPQGLLRPEGHQVSRRPGGPSARLSERKALDCLEHPRYGPMRLGINGPGQIDTK